MTFFFQLAKIKINEGMLVFFGLISYKIQG